jgi:hypothetical protein
MDYFQIVGQAQTEKLMVSEAKKAYIEKSAAFHMREFAKGFFCDDLNEDFIENADETHFVINMDNGKTLGFRGDNLVKNANVVVGDLKMTMVIRISNG